MSKWTKGPWHYASASVNHYVYNSNGGKVAVVGGSIVEATNARKVADARLISAAPDLAEALEALLAVEDGDLFGEQFRVALNLAKGQARAALRKAKGEA